MNKTIRNLAIAALFVFPGISGFPQEVQQEEAPAAKPVVEENVAFPILIVIPIPCVAGLECRERQTETRGVCTAFLCFKGVASAIRECTLVTSETRTLADGWYAVKEGYGVCPQE